MRLLDFVLITFRNVASLSSLGNFIQAYTILFLAAYDFVEFKNGKFKRNLKLIL